MQNAQPTRKPNPVRRAALALACAAALPWTAALLATPWAAFAPAILLARILLEASAARLLRGEWPSLRHAAAIPLKDAVYLAGWFAPLAVRQVHWRGRRYRLARQARMIPLPPAAAPAAASRRAA